MNPQTSSNEAELDALWHNQTQTEHGITLCRAALATAKRNLCPHGVDWRNCHQHDGHVVAGEVIKETE
jgi:D-mannonate dehydratase